MSGVVNRGTGAGGGKTNANGIPFEKRTENESRLLKKGFIRKDIPGKKNKNGFYLVKELSPTESITYVTKSGLKAYCKHFFKKEMCREPDEAYLIKKGDDYILKVLEKKNQNTPGSVDTKLLAGGGFIDEYEFLLGENFKVEYAFCLSAFLQKDYTGKSKKSEALRHVLKKQGIPVLFGEDTDYFEKLDNWLSL